VSAVNHRHAGAAVTAALVVLALAACAPAAAPTPTSRPAAATTTPSPSPTPIAKPGWPFAIGCAGIASLDQVRTWTAPDVVVTTDESKVPAGPFDIAALQGGALVCDWSSPETQSNGVSTGALSVHVLPDATAAEQHFVAQVGNMWGADMDRECDAGGCGKVALVSGNEVEIGWNSQAHAQDADAGLVAFEAIVAAVTGRLADPGARGPAWTAPVGPLPETFCDGGTGRPQFIPAVAAALGFDASQLVSAGGVGGDQGVIGAAVTRTDVGECAWGSQDDTVFAGIWIVAGASWSLPLARANVANARDAGDPAHPGAFVTDDGHGNFDMWFASSGSLVLVDLSETGMTADQAPARMAAVAHALQL
jgi:hypothetical protein